MSDGIQMLRSNVSHSQQGNMLGEQHERWPKMMRDLRCVLEIYSRSRLCIILQIMFWILFSQKKTKGRTDWPTNPLIMVQERIFKKTYLFLNCSSFTIILDFFMCCTFSPSELWSKLRSKLCTSLLHDQTDGPKDRRTNRPMGGQTRLLIEMRSCI